MTKIIFDNKNVYVSCNNGELLVQPLTNAWLYVIGAIHDGDKIKVIEDRKELQDHQYDLSCVGGIDMTNHMMLSDLLKEYHPQERGILSEDEFKLVNEMLQLENRTVIELRNLRDFVVARLGDSDNLEDWDRMSAITHCIDTELFDRGAEV